MAPTWAYDIPMPCDMVIKKPGMKNASGVSTPRDSTIACSVTVTIASTDPINTIVSPAARLPTRLAIKLPVKNPIGNSRK